MTKPNTYKEVEERLAKASFRHPDSNDGVIVVYLHTAQDITLEALKSAQNQMLDKAIEVVEKQIKKWDFRWGEDPKWTERTLTKEILEVLNQLKTDG